MFSFLKKITGNSDLSNDFSFIGTDIHSHLIPGIDDGCVDMESSIQCIERFIALGYKKIITTPHIMADVYPNTPEIIKEGLANLQNELNNRGISIEIEAAAEYKIDDLFVDLLEKDNLLTFGDKHILVEVSFVAAPVNMDAVLFSLLTKGYKPILAHPERYNYWAGQMAVFEKIRSMGCYLQLNLMSLSNHYGPRARKTALELLDKGYIDFFGTDVHRPADLKLLEAVLHSNDLFHKISNVQSLNKNL
ncbi:Tyrosine-protein phosphatase YwqE [Pseudarcicella hirudinis]|uniref:protein-tyrosine-phosphatase n=1 Tax=Pseudarcicella hirudinis TaxID=1079859 RepID=A0A1I5YPS9_9BACT|nr:CpsB/CapC family capsule biosynthesis tyrosine phosphatase [Pseudarcicella hirudinis]SFQ46203.1 Tyrosine-protein phosphatase YwqE [Pseudarcicella hirudinis]